MHCKNIRQENTVKVKFKKDTVMKKIFAIAAIALATIQIIKADDRPVTFNQLPAAAQAFINTNYPG